MLKKAFVALFAALLIVTLISFYVGNMKLGIGTGTILMLGLMAFVQIYMMKNATYMHEKRHEEYIRRRR